MKRTLLILLLLAACKEEVAAVPGPVPLDSDATSYFCQMEIAGHPGPKAQIHLEGFPAPIFFAQVRDALAYLRSPERTAPVLATYVSDMGDPAATWEAPGDDNWTLLDGATLVVGSDRVGGMGAPEIAPFSDPAAAQRFIAAHGGAVVPLAAIPDEAVLGPVEVLLPEADS